MNKDIFVFGDSIGDGSYDTEHGGWASLLAMSEYKKRLQACNYDAGSTIVNMSVCGETTADLLLRIETDLKTRKAEADGDVALLAMGTNDAAFVDDKNQVAIEDFKGNIVRLINTLRMSCKQVLVLGLSPVYESLSKPWCFNTTVYWENSTLQKYDEALCQIANDEQVTFIPLQDVLDTSSDQHLPDGLHPNAEGHRLIFERVKQTLEKEGIL